MQTSSGHSSSSWMDTSPDVTRPPLGQDLSADVCIVGAGIAGMSTACLLALEGRSVVVLDRGNIGGGETGRTTAHLSNALDDGYIEIERIHGQPGAKLAAESHTAAIDRIESLARQEGIDCQFERIDGYLFLHEDHVPRLLDDELAAAHRAGLFDVERLERAITSAFDTGPCLRFPRQAHFHPLRYLAGLTRVIESRGGKIFTGTRVVEVHGGQPAWVETIGGNRVTAGSVVVATNPPINNLFAIHTKQAPYRTFAIGLPVHPGSIPNALFWDTGDPYHYMRLQHLPDGRDLLIVGGEDHKTGHADDAAERFARLERWTRLRFTQAGEVRFRWSGQVLEPVDGLGFIGHNPLDKNNVYVATGDSGHGMTHGTIAAILLTDLIMGRENRWAKLYDPSRKIVGGLGDYAMENLDVAAQYTEHLTPGGIGSIEELRPGEGAIMRQGLRKVAVCRDDAGALHACSANCTHLGCVVHWNSLEKTWDCPCHGSRFDPQGRVVSGPAARNLKPSLIPASAHPADVAETR